MEQTLSFSSLDLNSSVISLVEAAGFKTPTPIQAKSIPLILKGRDVLGLAQTGTGKTAAFVLPIINKLLATKERRLSTLILVPTRELANQVDETIKLFSSRDEIRSVTVYGGVSFNSQVRELRNGVDIIVACPGRLIEHIQEKTINLGSVQTLVLDEADQMFDMGFLPALKKIVQHLPAKRQNLLFSATMPQEIRRLALDILKDPAKVEVSPGKAADTLTHHVYEAVQGEKAELLKSVLKSLQVRSVLVFTRTKHGAKKLARELENQKHAVTALQGNMSQAQRNRAMEGFRDGTFQILVATDIAARGIDVSKVSHVFNFDMPDTVEAYVHRVGRTGRATRTGNALSFVTPDDREMLRAIERHLDVKMTVVPVTHVPVRTRVVKSSEEARAPRTSPSRWHKGHMRQAGRAN